MNAFVLGSNMVRSLLTAGDEQPSWAFILNISLPGSPWAAPCFLLPLGTPYQMEKELITTREWRIDPNTYSSSSVNPSFLFLRPKLPVAPGENLGHGKSQGPSLMLHSSRRSWLRGARLSLAAPSWVTCFLSSTISLMRLFHKEKNEIKVVLMLWGTRSDCR